MNHTSATCLRKIRHFILFSIISVLIVWPAVLSAESVDLVLLHMNDTHGNLSATPETIQQKVNHGSMPRLARVLLEVQQENKGRVLTFHAGDLFSRGEPVTIHTGGGIMIDILEKLHVDVLVPGNGDYYFGLPNLIKQTERMSEKVITANIKRRSTQELYTKPHKIITIKGVRIGIVGLGFIYPTHYSSKALLFENPVKVGKEQAEALRDHVDLLIALTHIGHRWDTQLAKQVPEFDIIIGGHSHTVLKEPVLVPREQGDGNVVVLQAGDHWRFLGRADVRMEKVDDRFKATNITAALLEIDETVEPDPELNAFMQNARKPFEEVIAQTQAGGDKDAMLKLVQEAVKDCTSADIIVLDNGVVQAELAEGPVRVGDVYRVHPFRNQVLRANISGKALASILPKIAQNKKVVMTATASGNIAEGGCFLIDGKKIEPDRMYIIAVNDFAIGKCSAISPLAFENTHQRIDSVLLRRFRAKSSPQGSNPWNPN